MTTVPITTLPLFPRLDGHLIDLLRTLPAADWTRPTRARQWTVRDVAAHLLDGNLRAIALYRDGFMGEAAPAITSYGELVAYLNELNATWVRAARRLSPALLTDLLELTGRDYVAQLQQLDPFADAVFSVAWAGDQVSPNWFHIAREYTEKFHHQLQIREAVDQPEPLRHPDLFRPFIHTLLCGLPHTYRNVVLPEGATVQFRIGDLGDWYLLRQADHWQLRDGTAPGRSVAGLTLPPDTAWKLFTKGLSPADARTTAQLTGDTAVAAVALTLVAVMA